jgi:pSer/pThr/pTyr-binding forkhead associated (FHA) protein
MNAALEIQNGSLAGERVEFSRLGSYTVGRRSANDVKVVDQAISRHHCRVDYDGEFFWLVDCGSHNGTFVNGQRVTKCMLYDGDVIVLGHTRLVFCGPQGDEEDDGLDL